MAGREYPTVVRNEGRYGLASNETNRTRHRILELHDIIKRAEADLVGLRDEFEGLTDE